MTNDELLRTYPQAKYVYVDTADGELKPQDVSVRLGRFIAKFRFGDFWTMVFEKAV